YLRHANICTHRLAGPKEAAERHQQVQEEVPMETRGGDHRASCNVNCPTVCTPTTHGGLGILDLERFSRALRLRWLWIAWT
uniref:Uncharacterized protein n=1 Tax=Aegilops tauschii subsp. strangulata TaxID=200361 RepID=A0A453M1J2_AEGTS